MLNLLKSDRLFAKGQRLMEKDHLEEAIRLFEAAVILNPNSSGAFLQLGLAQSQIGQYDEAVESIGRAINIRPSNPVYPALLGLVHYDRQRYSEALAAFDQSLSIDPEYILPVFLKALTKMAQGEVGEAYEDLLKHAPNLGSLYQGRLLFRCESYLRSHRDAAENVGLKTFYVEKGLQSYPRNKLHRSCIQISSRMLSFLNELSFDRKRVRTRRHVLRGNCLNRLAEWDAAIDEYQKALELNPRLRYVKENLVEIYLEISNYDQALKYTVQLDEEERQPSGQDSEGVEHSSSQYALALGVIGFYLGRYDQAEKDLTHSLKSDPINYLPHYFLGLCHLEKGDQKTAYSHLRKSVALLNPKIVIDRLEMVKKLDGLLHVNGL